MYNKLLLLSAILFLVAMLSIGCGEGTDPLLSSSQRELGEKPAMPVWSDVPVDIEHVWDNRFKVTLRWKPVTTDEKTIRKTNIAGYKVLKYDSKEKIVNSFLLQSHPASDEEFYVDTSTDLLKDTEFSYAVIAFDTYMQDSRASAPKLVKITGEILKRLKAPQNFNWIQQFNEVTIYWDPVIAYEDGTSTGSDLYGYEVYRNKTSERPEIPIAILYPQQTSYADVSIQYGVPYNYWVRAVGKLGNKSPLSNPISVVLAPPGKPQSESDHEDSVSIPNPPHIRSVTSQTGSGSKTTWTIQWDKPLFNMDGSSYQDHSYYKIFRSETLPGIFTLIGISSTSSFSQTVSNDSEYFYKVSAVDDYSNESDLSNAGIKYTFHSTTNSTSLNFRVDNNGSSAASVILKWNDIYTLKSDALSYNVYRSVKETGPYFIIGSIEDNGMDLTYTDMEVIPDIIYYYRITIVDSEGESEMSYYARGIAKNPQIVVEAESGTLIRNETSPAVNSGNSSNAYFRSTPGTKYSGSWALTYIPGNSSVTALNTHYFTIGLPVIPAGTYDVTVYFEYSKFRGNYSVQLFGESGSSGILETARITTMDLNGFYSEGIFTNETHFSSDASLINDTFTNIVLDEEEKYYLKIFYQSGGHEPLPGMTIETGDGDLKRLVLDRIVFTGK